jgi:hypothetical protein
MCSAICEEFTDTILFDSKRNSIILNISSEWFEVLNTRLENIGFKLIHKSKLGSYLTCAYAPKM